MAIGRDNRPSARPESPPTATQTAARATALTIGLVLVSRVLGVLRNVLLGHIFGQDAQTDLYWAAFGVPDLIALVIAGGGLSSVFVPVFAAYWNDRKEEDAWHVFGSILCIVMVSVALLVGVMEIGVNPLTHRLNSGFTPEQVAVTAHFSRILLPAQWFLIVGGFMMGTLYARKRFLIPALGPLFYNAGTIIGALSQWRAPHPDMTAMAWGTLIGAFVGSCLLPLYELARVGVKWRPSFDTSHEGVRRVGRLMLPVLLGLSLGQLIMWITQRCLPADNRITALKNAYDLTQAPIGIFAQAFAIVLLPTISTLAANQQWQDFRLTISRGIRNVLFLTVPASLLMAALALPLVRVISEHGKFTDANAHVAATALCYYSLGTFAWSGLAILARGFYARQDTWTPLYITTPMVFVFYVFVKIALYVDPKGVVGLALAASIVGTITMLLFLFLLQKRVGSLNMGAILRSVTRTLIAGGAATVAAHYLARGLEGFLDNNRLAWTVTLIVAGSVGIGIYVIINLLFRSPELKSIGTMFRRAPKPAE